jgi:hypothetical protein
MNNIIKKLKNMIILQVSDLKLQSLVILKEHQNEKLNDNI